MEINLQKKLDKNDLALFANEVFDKWFELGAEAKRDGFLLFQLFMEETLLYQN